MPEWAECKLEAEYANSILEKSTNFSFVLTSETKLKFSCLDKSFFTCKVISRGKEIQFLFDNTKLTFTLGMSGRFTTQKTKHWKLEIKNNSQSLYFDDPRRFGKFDFRDWNSNRSPDPVEEHDLWKTNFQKLIQLKKYKKLDLYQGLMNQELCNGIGNYLAAEIIGRLDINPFQSITILDNNEFYNLVKQTLLEAYSLGGGQLLTWKNHSGKKHLDWQDWMKFYRNSQSVPIKSPTGRTFWCHQKWQKYNTWKI